MSDFDKEFSQFSSGISPSKNPRDGSTNESDDFEQLDPFSAHDQEYPRSLSTSDYLEREQKFDSSSIPDPQVHSSSDRPLLTLGLDESQTSQGVDDAESPIVMVGGAGDSGIEGRDVKMNLGKYDDLLDLGSFKSDYSGDAQTTTESDNKKTDVVKTTTTPSYAMEEEIKTTVPERDYLKDFEPEKPSAPLLEESPVIPPETMFKSSKSTSEWETKPESKPSPVPEKEVVTELPPPYISDFVTSVPKKEKIAASPSGCWFSVDNLDPRVVELLYWRDVKTSGVVFGTSLLVLLSLSYCSLISVVAYLSLALLTVTLTFRIYKNVLQAVQKSGEGHPFKEYLEMDVSLPQDKVQQVTDVIVKRLNALTVELRRLFLVEDLVDSIKFGLILWCFTYIGAWFNGMTLVILAFLTAFTAPKVYETYKEQIDHYIGIASAQIGDVMEKVKAKIPIGKKAKTQ